mgnify:CR=1 FL=1
MKIGVVDVGGGLRGIYAAGMGVEISGVEGIMWTQLERTKK